jgi:hypothetical protein
MKVFSDIHRIKPGAVAPDSGTPRYIKHKTAPIAPGPCPQTYCSSLVYHLSEQADPPLFQLLLGNSLVLQKAGTHSLSPSLPTNEACLLFAFLSCFFFFLSCVLYNGLSTLIVNLSSQIATTHFAKSVVISKLVSFDRALSKLPTKAQKPALLLATEHGE